MKHTWNDEKAEKVKAEHKVEFEKLIDVFDDVFAVDFIDEEHSTDNEIRYAVIGKTAEYGMIYLVYISISADELRFITARKAEKWMVSFYRESNAKY
jgi:uncharacterized protein